MSEIEASRKRLQVLKNENRKRRERRTDLVKPPTGPTDVDIEAMRATWKEESTKEKTQLQSSHAEEMARMKEVESLRNVVQERDDAIEKLNTKLAGSNKQERRYPVIYQEKHYYEGYSKKATTILVGASVTLSILST